MPGEISRFVTLRRFFFAKFQQRPTKSNQTSRLVIVVKYLRLACSSNKTNQAPKSVNISLASHPAYSNLHVQQHTNYEACLDSWSATQSTRSRVVRCLFFSSHAMTYLSLWEFRALRRLWQRSCFGVSESWRTDRNGKSKLCLHSEQTLRRKAYNHIFFFFFTVTDSNNVDMVNYMAERRVMWRQGKQCISNSLKGGKKSSGACTGKAPNIPSDLSLSLSHSHLHFHLPVYSLWNDISLKNQMVSQLSATSPSFGDVSKWMNVCKVLVTVSVLDHGFPTRGKTT